MELIQIRVSEEQLESLVRDTLLESAEICEDKKARKALLRAAAYYMTYDETVEHFGKRRADEYWK
jgi:hypothetical protein